MSNLRDKIARALAEWQDGPDAAPWVYDMYAEAADAVLAVIDLDKVRAEAWGEGYEAAMADDRKVNLTRFTPNPYRKAEQ